MAFSQRVQRSCRRLAHSPRPLRRLRQHPPPRSRYRSCLRRSRRSRRSRPPRRSSLRRSRLPCRGDCSDPARPQGRNRPLQRLPGRGQRRRPAHVAQRPPRGRSRKAAGSRVLGESPPAESLAESPCRRTRSGGRRRPFRCQCCARRPRRGRCPLAVRVQSRRSCCCSWSGPLQSRKKNHALNDTHTKQNETTEEIIICCLCCYH